ncbi:phytanoyl-CoA dioxygenase family protein, partial [Humibacillus sp. DSM 29435]|uniref:phytanoyl-CoA dioxygenase family protein n=1 Tax=Humibacillus sp. DSM 29435 TaxID=1869167 RepID=UPI001C2F1F55
MTATLFDDAGPSFKDHYHRHGFALLRDALSAEEVSAVNADAVRLWLPSVSRGPSKWGRRLGL